MMPISSPVARVNDSRVEVEVDSGVGTAVALSILRILRGLRGGEDWLPRSWEKVIATEREVVFDQDEAGVRVRYRRSEPPPPYTYSVTLEVEEAGVWRTVRLWDNADDVHEHHVHEYTRIEGKQEPLIRKFDSINEAMAVANFEARKRTKEIVRQWRRS